MATRRSRIQRGLDTNFIINLQDQLEIETSAWEIAREREILLVVTDTAIGELAVLSETGEPERVRFLARDALAALRRRWMVETAHLSDLEASIAWTFAEICLQNRLLPESEKNDALILAEAAVREIPFLLTSDAHLLDIDRERLGIISQANDLMVVSILHPKSVIRSLG